MQNSRQAGISFANRIFGPRVLGCALSFVYIVAVIHERGAPQWVWGWMLLNGFAWPWLARATALRSALPYRAELRNLLLDSVFAGGWVVVMQFNLMPSVLLLSMVAMNNVAAAGIGFMLRGLVAQLAGVTLAGALLGLKVYWQTSLNVILASLPMLVAYPFSVGWASYTLAARLFEQRKALGIANSFDDNHRLHGYNRWMGELAADYQRCWRSNGHATLAIISIDNLPQLQHVHGYWVAQAVTARLGHLILQEARPVDALGSNGADTFYLLFPTLRERGASQCLARIRNQFCHFGSGANELPDLLLNIGLAEYSSSHHSERDWFEAAQQALEQARQEATLTVSA